MKKFGLLLLGCCAAAFGTNVMAQSCSANAGTISATGNYSGNTCEAAGSTLAKACSNANTFNGAGVSIFQVNFGSPNNVTFTVTGAAFIPAIALIKATCSSSTACIIDQSAASGNTVAGSTTGQTAGTYFLIVGDYDVDSPGCGAFNLAVTGTLPVSLQNFSVE